MLSATASIIITIVVLVIAFVVLVVIYNVKDAAIAIALGIAGCLLCSLFTLRPEWIDAIVKMLLITPAFGWILRTNSKQEKKKSQQQSQEKQ